MQELQQQLADLQQQMNDEIGRIPGATDPNQLKIDTIEIKPRKSDIIIEEVSLLWK